MPRKPATEEQRREVRRRIRRAAAEVYAEKGAIGVSVRAIAERAGVSTGTLYGYYESLGELMRSLWAGPVAKASEGLEEIAKANPDPRERIRALLEAYAEFALENRDVFRGALLFVRPQPLPESERRPLDQFVFYDLLRAALREGQAAGQVRAGNADELAQVLWAGIHGALALPVNLDIATFAPPETLARQTTQALLRSLRP